MNFENIAGYENEKKELLQLRYMLHNAEMYREKGIRIPHGLALYGRPGIGKTVMARSIADEGIAFIELRAADCCSDDTEGAIRMAFEHAKENSPAVLLLDELDKIAGTSHHFFMQANDSVKKILLQELDSLGNNDDVLVVATCNNTECLGNALLRPGRFDRLIAMSAPDEETRKKILRQYFGKLNLKKALISTIFQELPAVLQVLKLNVLQMRPESSIREYSSEKTIFHLLRTFVILHLFVSNIDRFKEKFCHL